MRAEKRDLLPVAITGGEGPSGCVAALTLDGTWVRPGPIAASTLYSSESPFSYGRLTSLVSKPCQADDARAEDHELLNSPCLGPVLSAETRMALYRRVEVNSVYQSLDGYHSLALIRPKLEKVYVRRSFKGVRYVRAVFCDGAGDNFDWIVMDLGFLRRVEPLDDGGVSSRLDAETERLQASSLWFALGLTNVDDRFPGRFGGCHPLVVGVHAEIEEIVE